MTNYKKVDADTFEAAKEAFIKDYSKTHRQPTHKQATDRNYFSILMLSVILIAATLLSALRTGPVFAEIADGYVSHLWAVIEALCAVVSIELFLIFSARMHVKEFYAKQGYIPRLGRWLTFSTTVTFFIAIAANIYATFGVTQVTSIYNIIITLLVGASAPLLAYVGGHMVTTEYLRSVHLQDEYDDQYGVRLDEWNRSMEQVWGRKTVQQKWIDLVTHNELSVTNYDTVTPVTSVTKGVTSPSTSHNHMLQRRYVTHTPVTDVTQSLDFIPTTFEDDYLPNKETFDKMSYREIQKIYGPDGPSHMTIKRQMKRLNQSAVK